MVERGGLRTAPLTVILREGLRERVTTPLFGLATLVGVFLRIAIKGHGQADLPRAGLAEA